MKVGILETGLKDAAESDLQFLEETFEYARVLDERGYSRIWFSEHQEFGPPWKSPEILLPVIAGITNTIKVGAAGLLLPLHNPLRVAQNFKVLGSVFQDRIDLGFAKALTASDLIGKELAYNYKQLESTYKHHETILKIHQLLHNSYRDEETGESIMVQPLGVVPPEIWVLSSSGNNYDFAAKNYFNYSVSLFHQQYNDKMLEELKVRIDKYKEEVALNGKKTQVNIAIAVICSDNKDETEKLIRKTDKVYFHINKAGSVEEVAEYIHKLKIYLGIDEIILNLIGSSMPQKTQTAHQLADHLLK